MPTVWQEKLCAILSISNNMLLANMPGLGIFMAEIKILMKKGI